MTLFSSLRFFTRCAKTASAAGLRQMLPRQTIRTRVCAFALLVPDGGEEEEVVVWPSSLEAARAAAVLDREGGIPVKALLLSALDWNSTGKRARERVSRTAACLGCHAGAGRGAGRVVRIECLKAKGKRGILKARKLTNPFRASTVVDRHFFFVFLL